MKILTPKNQIECARVYVSSHERSKLTLKCFFCGREFLHWTKFTAHIEMRHFDLERAYMRVKDAWLQLESQQTSMAVESAGESTYVEEQKEDQQSKETMQHSTEFVLIPDVPDIKGKSKEFRKDVVYIDEEVKQQQSLVQFEIERITENLEYVDASQSEHTVNEDYRMHNFDSAATVDPLSKGRPNYSKKKSVLDEPQRKVQDTKVACSETVVENETQENKNMSQTHSKTTRKSIAPLPHDEMHAGSHFFQLRHTDPSLMFAFIEIIRRHPCQWNPQHKDYEIKDRRDESAEKICNELQERFNLYLSPQDVRNSVCYLRRWYEREFLKNTGLLGLKKIVCAHPEYYAKLSEFMPHTHLGIRHCDKCPRKFRSEQQLQSHIYQIHGGELPYHCAYCDRKFLYQSMLRHHENRHTKKRTFQCKLCDYSCPAKTDYSIHMVMHTDIRAYVCDLCGAAYKSSASLNVHKRSHGAPQFTCELCGKKFYENCRYKQHLWQHGGDIEAEALVAAQEAEMLAEAGMEIEEKNKEKQAGNQNQEELIVVYMEDDDVGYDVEVSGCTT